MNQSQPKFKIGDYLQVFLRDDNKPSELIVINVFQDKNQGWCYVVKSGDNPLTISEKDLIDIYQASAIPPDEMH